VLDIASFQFVITPNTTSTKQCYDNVTFAIWIATREEFCVEVGALEEVIKGKVQGNMEICQTACPSLLTKQFRNWSSLKLRN
jgi:uncharacterized protein YqgV (UPF0045/DUF77 family)